MALLLQVPVPEGLDVLLVEQEVVGTEQSALQVRAQHARIGLRVTGCMPQVVRQTSRSRNSTTGPRPDVG